MPDSSSPSETPSGTSPSGASPSGASAVRWLLVVALVVAAGLGGLVLGRWMVPEAATGPGGPSASGGADAASGEATSAAGSAARRGPGGRPPSGQDSTAPASGKWTEARTPWTPEPGAEAVMNLPYLQGYEPAGDGPTSVVVNVPGRVQPGLNLVLSGHDSEALLMDLEGRTLHRWRYPLRRFVPDLYAGDERIRKLEYFRRARVLPDGGLLAIFEGLGLIALDARSNLLWSYRGGAHHDLDLADDGTIWILDREGKALPRIDPERGVLEDRITVLSPDGEVLRSFSLLEAFERSDYAPLLHRMAEPPDILHTNTLEILDGSLADEIPAFAAGHLLISVLALDTVAVVDPDTETVVWALAGLWRKQHQPTVVPGGRLLVFDNLGADGGAASRVLELDPRTQEITWRWGGAEVGLLSRTLGSVQRLANGNVLITESENGRALEVERGGAVVWEYRNPRRAGEDNELVAALFEVERLPQDFPFRGLEGSR